MGDKIDNKGDYIEVTYDNGIVKIPVTDEEEMIAKADSSYENYKREERVKLKRYFHYNGLNMLYLFGKVWLQWDSNVPKSERVFFKYGNEGKWYEGWFRFVIGKYGFGMFFIDKVLMNDTWNSVVSRWEDKNNG